MDREEAADALALLKRIVTRARDDTALQNWGMLWILHGFTNGAAFVATNVLLRQGNLSPLPYAALWAATIGINFLSIFTLKTGSAGVRSFVENQIWIIWTTFIVASSLVCVINYVMGLEKMFAGIVMAILAATAFSAMGGVIGKRWFAWAAVFAGASLVMTFVPEWQFAILGALWLVAQCGGGVLLVVEKRRRLAAGAGEARLV